MNIDRINKNKVTIKKIDKCLYWIALRQYYVFKNKELKSGVNCNTTHIDNTILADETKLNILEKTYIKLVEKL